MGRRILIVDDNEDTREGLRELLRSWGHEVDIAADGCEGITLALEHRPAVVVLDLGLPDLDGHEVARRIRADADRPYIIALTGSYEDENAAAGMFDAYILKPADPDALRVTIEGA